MSKTYIMDRDTIAKEIIPYLHKDVYPILTNEIPSKTKGKIWIGSKEVQQRTGIESAIVYEELLGKLVEYSYRMFTYNWGYFYLNNKIVEASKAETLILGGKLVTSLYNSSYGQHSYFDDENRKRCYFQTKLWEDQSKYWNDLSEAEKMEVWETASRIP